MASQEGRYLASLFNKYHVGAPIPNTTLGVPSDAAPFRYHHLGAFAYVGSDAAVLETTSPGDPPPPWSLGTMSLMLALPT